MDWSNSTEGTRLITTMILPFVAIVVAGILAALIARGAVSRLIAKQERAERASAIEALIAVGEKASQWSGLSNHTREHFETQSSVASIRVRVLPAKGAAMASAWAEYQLAEIKRNSANFSVTADQGYAEYSERLIEWHHRPSRARKIFLADLDRFRANGATEDIDLIERQRRWKAEQAATATVATPTATATPAPAAPVAPKVQSTPVQQAAPVAPPVTPSAPIVPPASTRTFTPRPTETGEVITATIDEDTPTETSKIG
ncbi:Tfp pilus assembly protein PilE [Conyzicola lurida]|uniref:Tfp pilus assembly protein PilE n=1 Tax=Conyzicola lurida TaxID=1172621 RepID=A0A841APZ3_9MICO|nr:hypothetical protein [Conyzicola lurida]MBB5843635.1 Tfp pilus assembly protein PilE [Conyzicola lurida]